MKPDGLDLRVHEVGAHNFTLAFTTRLFCTSKMIHVLPPSGASGTKVVYPATLNLAIVWGSSHFLMVATSAPVALRRFTRASSFPAMSSLHAFQVTRVRDGKFVEVNPRSSLDVSCQSFGQSFMTLVTSGRTRGASSGT